jgi:tetratricopeptide (TPR) repeat protein
MRNIFILSLILFSTQFVSLEAQTKRTFIEAADEAFENRNYYAALVYYNNALEFDPNDTQILLKSAESARLFNSYKMAAERYSILVDSLQQVADPKSVFWLGQMHQKMGNYEKAIFYFNMYISEHTADDEDIMTKRAKKELEAVRWSDDFIKNPAENITLERLSGDVNSPDSDFAPLKIDESLFFSSHRFPEKKPKIKPGRNLSRVMVSDKEGNTEGLEDLITDENLNVAYISFNPRMTKAYFTQCEYDDSLRLRCDIYSTDIAENGKFENITKLSAPVNIEGHTNTQPNIGIDDETGNEILFFSSDRPGGKGKLDIWYVVIDRRLGFSNAVNLSAINTAEDDITPFFHIASNTLYFSSEGKLGLGGLDIYSSIRIDGEFQKAEILPPPLNSSYHDAFYTLSEDGQEAHFASNREGSLFIDEMLEACCFDIYKADIEPIVINLNALTYCKITGRELPRATVVLIDKVTGEILATVYNEDDNEHLFEVEPGREYTLIATRENYFPDTISLSTVNIRKSEDLIRKMYLGTDMMILDIFTFDLANKLPLAGVTITLEDLSDPTKSKIIELNELGNYFNYMIDRGKIYKVTATKPGFLPVSEIIDTRPYAEAGLITKNLYLDKFELEKLLPIALFFDNDYPDPKSRSTATTSVYNDLLTDYMNKKPEYINNYITGLPQNQRTETKEMIDIFFEGDVKGGYDMLRIFMDGLETELRKGTVIEISIKGFASPRFESKYNLVLSQRRVNSVRNEFMNYDNGKFSDYILNRQLIITEVSYGDELAAENVIADLYNRRGSVYSVEASRERRVEIITVKRLR